jgi:preprotein translocase subunit SecG
MQRVTLFLLIIAVAVLAVISTFGTFLPRQMMSGMGGMMGEGSRMGNFLWPSILSASTAVIVVAVTYVILFPSIKYSKETQSKPEVPVTTADDLDPMSIVMRVVKPDERAALEVLRNSGGVCLQKDITYKTGVSKLKTHRIVARLAERGIIQVRKIGKTNEISAPAWLGTRQSAEKPVTADAS